MAINTRPLTPADAEAFAALRLHGIQTYPNAFLLTEDEARQTPIERVAQFMSHGLYGAFDGVRLVGFIGLRTFPWTQTAHRAEMGPFYVHPDYHGTQVADVLMTDALTHIPDVTQVELWVEASNHRARGFYTKHGFAKIGTLPSAVRMGSETFNDVHMLRDMTRPLPAPSTDGICLLTPADWRAFDDIRTEMLTLSTENFGTMPSEWTAKAPDEVADWLRKTHIWAVLEGGRILAAAGWHVMAGLVQAHRGHVVAVYTRPEARGRGLFAQLMQRIEDQARGAGMIQLELDVGAENERARAAYERAGFTVTGGIPRALNHNGAIANQLYMVRPL